MKLSIIGAGKVGVTLAFAAMQRNFLREIVLVGRNTTRTTSEALDLDEKRTMPLSVYINDYLGVRDDCLSVPVVVGANGIERMLHPRLNPYEIKEFHASAEVVTSAIRSSL